MQLQQTLAALAAQGPVGQKPVVIRNMLATITTFTDDNTRITTTWAGYGDRAGKDVIEVPPSLLMNPQFREQVLRGIFAIEEDPNVLEHALIAQRADWDGRQLAIANAAVQVQQAQNQVVATGQPCIAPKGREICGSYALVMGKDPSEHPPLCGEHEKLAPQYAPQQTGRLVDGKPEVIWKRVLVTQI